MDISDEACYGDTTRQMSIQEICDSGDMKGIMTYTRISRKNMNSYLWVFPGGILLSMIIAAFFVEHYIIAAILGYFGGSFLSMGLAHALLFLNNWKVDQAYRLCAHDPKILPVEGPKMFEQLCHIGCRGIVHILEPKNPYSVLNAHAYPRIGYQHVFFEFADDHDRVMFQLSR